MNLYASSLRGANKSTEASLHFELLHNSVMYAKAILPNRAGRAIWMIEKICRREGRIFNNGGADAVMRSPKGSLTKIPIVQAPPT